MVRVNFDVSIELRERFKDLIGDQNMTNTFINFMENIVYNNANEKQLEQQAKDLDIKINSLQLERNALLIKLKNIKDIKENKLLSEQQEQEEKLSFDPFAHFEKGRSKLNEAGRCLYKVEKGNFIPDWAKTRNPKNPKDYATKILNKIIEVN